MDKHLFGFISKSKLTLKTDLEITGISGFRILRNKISKMRNILSNLLFISGFNISILTFGQTILLKLA